MIPPLRFLYNNNLRGMLSMGSYSFLTALDDPAMLQLILIPSPVGTTLHLYPTAVFDQVKVEGTGAFILWLIYMAMYQADMETERYGLREFYPFVHHDFYVWARSL